MNNTMKSFKKEDDFQVCPCKNITIACFLLERSQILVKSIFSSILLTIFVIFQCSEVQSGQYCQPMSISSGLPTARWSFKPISLPFFVTICVPLYIFILFLQVLPMFDHSLHHHRWVSVSQSRQKCWEHLKIVLEMFSFALVVITVYA